VASEEAARQRFEVSLKPVLLHVLGVGIGLFYLSAALLGQLPGSLELLPLALAAVLVVHEAVHALAAKLLGARRVGFGLAKAGRLVVGLSVSVGEPMPAGRWLLVALAPLLALSPPFLALARAGGPLAPFFAWLFLLNAVGSCGDVVLAWIAASAGRVAVRDMGDRIAVEGSPPKLWALALLDAVALSLLAPLAAAVLLQMLLAALPGSFRLELAGLLVAEKAVAEGRMLKVAVGPGALLPALAAVAAFEAVAGPRRARRLMQRLAAGGA
jgi:hypothetical protein